MTSDHDPTTGADEAPGARAGAHGTPMPVDFGADRQARSIWVVLLLGPVVWLSHFMLVYLVSEAGCTGDGPGLRLLDPPVPVVTTLASTPVAVALCAFGAVWGWRLWRRSRADVPPAADGSAELDGRFDDDRRRGALAFVGLLLSAFSVVAVLFTAAPALALGPC